MKNWYEDYKYCRKCGEWRPKTLVRCGLCGTRLRWKPHKNIYRGNQYP